MKKFLSLVLALVMTMSLVTVAGAKDFTDDSKIAYGEAVDVISAAGIMDGYTDGSFNPKGLLTRGAAAKIICNMILGPTEAGALQTVAAAFPDVPADHVFSGYIAYCASEGIIGGYTDGTFRPAAPLTGYAFMKMLLGALGYDAEIENYTGANFAVNVAKQALNLGLNDGLEGAFVGTKQLTREEAALYAFNTLQTKMVKYNSKSTITVGDIVITEDSDAVEITNGAAKETIKDDGYMQFGEKYFTKLVKSIDKDAYGRPATKWVYDKSTVGKYADEAIATYTTKFEANVVADELDDAGYSMPSTTATWDTANGTQPANWNNIALYQNGYFVKYVTAAELDAAVTAKSEIGGKGISVEFFADDDDMINRAVVIVTYLAKVDAIGKDKVSTKAIDERSLTLDVQGTIARYEDDTIGFDAVYEAVEKGDYVLVMPYGDNKVASDVAVEIAIPETVTGALTYTSSSSVKVGGEKYDLAATAAGAPYSLSSDDVTLYLDQYGYAIGCTADSSVSDKAVAVTKVYQTLNEDGELVNMIKGVTSDGAEVVWQYETGSVSDGKSTPTTVTGVTPAKDGLYVYSDLDDDDAKELVAVSATTDTADGAFVLVDTTAELKTNTKSVTTYNGVKSYYADDVKFIFVNDGKATVKEGAQKVAAGTVAYATIEVEDSVNYVTAVYVKDAAAASSTTSDEIVFVLKTDGTVSVTVDGKDKTFTAYKAYIDGEAVEGFYAGATTVDRFYSLEIDDESGAYITSGNAYTATTGELAQLYTQSVAAVVNNIMTIGGTDYDLSNAVIVDVTDNDNEVTTAALLKDAKAAGTVTVSFLYDADDNAVSYLYVTGYTEWVA